MLIYAYLLCSSQGMVIRRYIGHNGSLIRLGGVHNLCKEKEEISVNDIHQVDKTIQKYQNKETFIKF